jgi:hypothetical protein
MAGAQGGHVRQVARDRLRIVANDQLREHRFERRGRRQRSQPFDRIVRDHDPLVQDDDPIADALDDFENVRAVENRLTARRQRPHQVPQHHGRRDVEAGFRLVEDDDRGIMQQRRRDDDLLAHALRVRRDALIGRGAQVEQRQEAVDLAGEQRLRQLAQAADQIQVLAAGEERIEIGLLRYVAHVPVERDHVRVDVGAVVFDLPCRRLEQPRDHSRGRGLPRSIRSEVANHFARTDRQADVTHDGQAGEPLREARRAKFRHGYSRDPTASRSGQKQTITGMSDITSTMMAATPNSDHVLKMRIPSASGKMK